MAVYCKKFKGRVEVMVEIPANNTVTPFRDQLYQRLVEFNCDHPDTIARLNKQHLVTLLFLYDNAATTPCLIQLPDGKTNTEYVDRMNRVKIEYSSREEKDTDDPASLLDFPEYIRLEILNWEDPLCTGDKPKSAGFLFEVSICDGEESLHRPKKQKDLIVAKSRKLIKDFDITNEVVEFMDKKYLPISRKDITTYLLKQVSDIALDSRDWLRKASEYLTEGMSFKMAEKDTLKKFAALEILLEILRENFPNYKNGVLKNFKNIRRKLAEMEGTEKYKGEIYRFLDLHKNEKKSKKNAFPRIPDMTNASFHKNMVYMYIRAAIEDEKGWFISEAFIDLSDFSLKYKFSMRRVGKVKDNLIFDYPIFEYIKRDYQYPFDNICFVHLFQVDKFESKIPVRNTDYPPQSPNFCVYAVAPIQAANVLFKRFGWVQMDATNIPEEERAVSNIMFINTISAAYAVYSLLTDPRAVDYKSQFISINSYFDMTRYVKEIGSSASTIIFTPALYKKHDCLFSKSLVRSDSIDSGDEIFFVYREKQGYKLTKTCISGEAIVGCLVIEKGVILIPEGEKEIDAAISDIILE